MKEKFKKLKIIRDNFLEDHDYDKAKKEVEKLEISVPNFIFNNSDKETSLFVCPDTEYEFPFVFEIAKQNLDKAIAVIYDAIMEYYKYSDFYDGCTEFCINELLKIYCFINGISIVRFFDVCDVELLNIRKLNSQ